MTRIIMVRHGYSLANEQHVFAGIYDTPLTEIGHEQARSVAEYLRKNEKIDKIYTSDFSRVYHTVLPTAEAFGLTPIKDTGLREINGGLWECLPFDDIATYYADEWRVWGEDTAHAHPVGGESVRAVYERIVAHVKKLAAENDGKTILLGTHWTPVRSVLAHVMTGTYETISHDADEPQNELGFCARPDVKNASLHILHYENGELKPVRIGITEHLTRITSH